MKEEAGNVPDTNCRPAWSPPVFHPQLPVECVVPKLPALRKVMADQERRDSSSSHLEGGTQPESDQPVFCITPGSFVNELAFKKQSYSWEKSAP